MNRIEFERLRDLPDKKIKADIKFTLKKETSPNLTFDNIPLQNSLDWDILLNGTYKPNIPSVTFNFVLRGTGPICRLDVNGQVHRSVGRTHKHSLQQESDSKPSENLPHADARPDLADKSVREIWETLCKQAKIIHEGTFTPPDEEC